ncbi:MAG: hypothetical protein IT436_16105 [Phycisphaerales bacterium]|nr:hypothetical protein [Phycisphaerales bacterium]
MPTSSRRRQPRSVRKAALQATSRGVVPRGLARLSIADLDREIRRRQRGTKSLHRRRAKMLEKIAALDAQILAAGGTLDGRAGRSMARAGARRIRPKNDTNLIDALRALLKDKTMGVAEAAEAVQKAGYKSNAATFKIMVNAALGKKKHFKRVERGRYTAV